jgi:ABC-type Fe3+ transport system substrate-binding protein
MPWPAGSRHACVDDNNTTGRNGRGGCATSTGQSIKTWWPGAATRAQALVFARPRGDDRRNETKSGRTIMPASATHASVIFGSRHLLSAAVPLALLSLVAAFGLPARAQGVDQGLGALHAAAKAEGAFVLYVGGPTAPWEATARIFEQRYPGIKVSITGGFSNVLDKKIDQQLAAGKLEVDTAIFQTLQDFARWRADGRLLAFKPAGFDAIDPSFKDKDGAFYGVMVNAMPYMYNTEHVAPADVPDSALDFLKPNFRGKMVTPYPADDDATLWLFHKIVLKYGWDYMDKYMASKPSFIQGHLGQQRSIASGQNWVTFDSIFNITGVEKKAGKPVESHFSTVDATPIWPLTGAIFKDAPHPSAAKLFLSWLLEPGQQATTGTWSSRRDVPPPEGFRPIFGYQVVNDYMSFLTDEPQLLALRKRFEGYTGPVVNAGGVR